MASSSVGDTRTAAHGLSRRHVVFLYAPPWDGPTRFSKHHLALHLARGGNRVLYVEAPLGPLTLLRRRRRALEDVREVSQAPRAVAENLWVTRHFNPVPYHAVSPLTASRAANRLGQRLMAPALRRDLARLGFRDPILVAGLPHVADALDLLPHRLVVYHCADDYAHVRGFPASLPLLEADLCRASDLVVTTAETLCQDRLRFNPRTHWVPNGVDVDHFGQAALPAEDVATLKKPVVGFVGGLSEWVDVPLLAYLARERPSCTVALVGPAAVDLSALRELPNVRLLGPRPYAQVPRYLAGMDVAIIPFLHNQVTWNADPIKVYEYLAAGVPVVATDMPALRRLGHVVRLASTREDFLREIDAAVAEGRARRLAERRAEAARHSWRSRFEAIESLILERLGA